MDDSFHRLFERIRKLRVLVVGDLILDRYIWGNIDRVSPEAPVGILHVRSENETLGGACNVAANLAHLGVRAKLVGVVGNDPEGKKIRSLLKTAGIPATGVLTDPNRPTTKKTRLIAQNQQLLRIDRESVESLSHRMEEQIGRAIRKEMERVQGVVVSDYGKGVLTDSLLSLIFKEARRRGISSIVDPKGKDFKKYRGVTVITPNQKEAAIAAGIDIKKEADFHSAARRLFQLTDAGAVMITRGPGGISLFEKGGTRSQFPAEAKQVYDVTGAGDTVVAVFGAACFAGAGLGESARLANVAAGIQVGKLGTAVVTRSEIEHYLETQTLYGREKIVVRQELLQRIGPIRAGRKKIVFTNGCFDLLHIGHIKYLQKARSLGDFLVVGLNSDESVRRLKGPARPLIDEVERSHILAALDCVDLVVIFSEDTPLNLIRAVRPDVLVKGADYTVEEVVGHDEVSRWNGRVELVPLVKGKSTTEIIRRIADIHSRSNPSSPSALPPKSSKKEVRPEP